MTKGGTSENYPLVQRAKYKSVKPEKRIPENFFQKGNLESYQG